VQRGGGAVGRGSKNRVAKSIRIVQKKAAGETSRAGRGGGHWVARSRDVEGGGGGGGWGGGRPKNLPPARSSKKRG